MIRVLHLNKQGRSTAPAIQESAHDTKCPIKNAMEKVWLLTKNHNKREFLGKTF